jgi:hypothetical protein
VSTSGIILCAHWWRGMRHRDDRRWTHIQSHEGPGYRSLCRGFGCRVCPGGYEVQEKSTGDKQFYRFQKPATSDYPFMLELFSRQPDVLQVPAGSHLTPLPLEEDISSLSAILLDNDYYDFIRTGKQEIDGIPMVGASRLIALKARAWLDLTERAKRGEQIHSKTIRKHKNDVFRLYQILDPASDPNAPEAVKKDITEFISRMRGEDVDLKALGIRTGTRDDILAEIARVYRLSNE